MQNIKDLEPTSVFSHFEALTKIPRGSGDMERVRAYCMDFAKKQGLKAVSDAANNVIIYKPATAGYEDSEPVILQGHLDMVCQKDEGVDIDFLKDGLTAYIDGDYIKAKGTTLGADNGIAVAMMLSILEREDLAHPPIEAIFTTDEEIGMIGARALDLKQIQGKRMINLDSEDATVVTVSCAGGSEFEMSMPHVQETKAGTSVRVSVKGLKGGHSGVEINSGRVNANMLMGRLLNSLKEQHDFSIIRIDGGDKGNAIPVACTAQLVTEDAQAAVAVLEACAKVIKREIAEREPGFVLETEMENAGTFQVMDAEAGNKLIQILLCAPNGVMEMSAEIEGLVETSLNLGILKTDADRVLMHFALRSNKQSALEFLEERLVAFSKVFGCAVKTSGHYPPWEYNGQSRLQPLYKEKFAEKFGFEPAIEAIHAGLECGVFAAGIADFDCISIGPEMHDIHTTAERLGITSTKNLYDLILNVLKACK